MERRAGGVIGLCAVRERNEAEAIEAGCSDPKGVNRCCEFLATKPGFSPSQAAVVLSQAVMRAMALALSF
jgi:hypothetical protein